MDTATAVTVVIIFLSTGTRWSNCLSEGELIDRLLRNYERHALPSKNSTTEVKIGLYFNSLYEVDSAEMEFSGNFYLRQNWKDPRLKFDPAQLDGKKEFRISDDNVDKIWRPDIFFRNGKDVNQHQVIRDNVLLKLNSSGFLWFVVQLTVTFSCPMKLQKYPFDTQTCPILFESFGHTMDAYYLTWLKFPVQVDEAMQLPSYTLQDKALYDCSQNYTSGAFPCLEVRFVLKRDSGYFFIKVFIPTMLLVIMSWFVFWLDVQDFPQRLGLTFLLIVCFILLQAAVGTEVAHVSYTKALDVWMFMCLMFIFAVLIESIVVKVIHARSYKTTEHVNLDDPEVKRVPNNKVTHLIDLVSRVAFPGVYLLAIIIYFAVYRS